MRLPAKLRISIKDNETGRSHKIEFITKPFASKRYNIRFDDKLYKQDLTLTEFSKKFNNLIKTVLS